MLSGVACPVSKEECQAVGVAPAGAGRPVPWTDTGKLVRITSVLAWLPSLRLAPPPTARSPGLQFASPVAASTGVVVVLRTTTLVAPLAPLLPLAPLAPLTPVTPGRP